jgi:hypothetical protein
MACGVAVEDYFQPWYEQVLYLTFEGDWVGLYFPFKKKPPPPPPPHFLVKERYDATPLPQQDLRDLPVLGSF